MTTPAGYYDEQGNFIPGSFADQLDLPGPSGVDSAAASKAQGALTAEQKRNKQINTNIKARQAALKVLQNQLKNKNIKGAQRAKLQAQVSAAQAYLKTQQGLDTASDANIVKLQNKYYEASGQYEKLLEGANRDAFAALSTLFAGYGLGSLAPKIYEYAKQGYGADVISMLLQTTDEYKQRFAGNQARVKAGLPVLSPAEYLATEQSYRQILQDAGLPKGFYDSPTDFTNWISGDVSPTEIKGRVDLAVANTMQANNNTVRALQDLYGVDKSMITAYFLDPKRALPLLQKQSQAAQFGAEALKRGLTLDKQDLEDFVTAGLSLSSVSSGFQAVAEALPNIQAIAARYGESFSQRELEKDLIEGNVTGNQADARFLTEAPTNKRKRLASQERALFSGYGGATPGGLSAGVIAT